MENFSFLLRYLLKHKKSYLAGIIFIFITNWISVEIPRYLQISIDLLNENLESNMDLLTNNVLILIMLAVLMMVVRTLSRVLFFNPGRTTEWILKNEIFAHLSCLQKDFYKRYTSGTLISIVNNDINGVRMMSGVGMLQLFNIIFALSLTPFRMWEMSPSLTLYCAVPVILTFLIIRQAVMKLRVLLRHRMKDLQSLSTKVVNSLTGIDVIKGEQLGGWASKEFEKENQKLLKRSLELSKIRSFLMPLLGYTTQVMNVLILGVGGAYLIQQHLTVGEVVAFLSYSALLAMPFMQLGRMISIFQMGMVSIESIQKVLKEPISSQDMKLLTKNEKTLLFHQGIEVKNLTYQYPDADEPVLKNISFQIKAGEKIGILGKIGSGKSTLVNCLNRYLDIEAGQILIDHHDITQLSRYDLRSAVRTLTQEPFLFSDTVEENIKFGSTHFPEEEKEGVDRVLFQSNLTDEVKYFPDQENTLVGEKGIMLSGGQKQRLSLARAMYTPSKLLILDNMLSAVDYETERFLLHEIFEKTHTKSILVVSHRVSVLEKVDEILVLDKGAIIARGTHKDLLISSPYYRSTWELQQHNKGEVA